MRRVVVIGSKGQLGSDLVRVLGDPDRVVPLSHQDLEICDHVRTRELLTRLRPDAVINTAAYHRVDDCEDHESRAFETNADAVLNLGRICNDLDALLVHVSTDYVFGGDGGRTAPYTEQDPPSPLNVYGASKLAGENLLREECRRRLIVRTSGLYGLAGDRNFVAIMLRLAGTGRPIRGGGRPAPGAHVHGAPGSQDGPVVGFESPGNRARHQPGRVHVVRIRPPALRVGRHHGGPDAHHLPGVRGQGHPPRVLGPGQRVPDPGGSGPHAPLEPGFGRLPGRETERTVGAIWSGGFPTLTPSFSRRISPDRVRWGSSYRDVCGLSGPRFARTGRKGSVNETRRVDPQMAVPWDATNSNMAISGNKS